MVAEYCRLCAENDGVFLIRVYWDNTSCGKIRVIYWGVGCTVLNLLLNEYLGFFLINFCGKWTECELGLEMSRVESNLPELDSTR